jgi:hypothetical protein
MGNEYQPLNLYERITDSAKNLIDDLAGITARTLVAGSLVALVGCGDTFNDNRSINGGEGNGENTSQPWYGTWVPSTVDGQPYDSWKYNGEGTTAIFGECSNGLPYGYPTVIEDLPLGERCRVTSFFGIVPDGDTLRAYKQVENPEARGIIGFKIPGNQLELRGGGPRLSFGALRDGEVWVYDRGEDLTGPCRKTKHEEFCDNMENNLRLKGLY